MFDKGTLKSYKTKQNKMALSGIPNPHRAGRLALAEKCRNWTKTWRNLK